MFRKKSSNGFTLVELLAVIVILAVILLIAVPNVVSIINKTKNDAYNSQLDMIENMANLYVLQSGETYKDTDGLEYITLNDLYDLGVAPSPVIDPRCSDVFIGEETLIYITRGNYGTVSFDVIPVTACGVGDEIAPVITSVDITPGATSVIVNVTATDEGSRVSGYYYSLDGTTWSDKFRTSSFDVNNLELNTTYTIYVKVEDSYYNESTVTSKDFTTLDIILPTITMLEEDVWAASKDIVISYPNEDNSDYQYKIGDNDWVSYTSETTLTIDVNNTVIYTKVVAWDIGMGIDGPSFTVDKIDEISPVSVAPTIGTVTSSSITVIASGIDNESGVKFYYFSKDNGSTWTAGQTSSTYTFSSLNDATSYSIKVKVEDNASNSTTSSTVSATTLTGVVVSNTNGLIPIKWTGSAWVVTTASDSSWHNYYNQEWANAISVTSSAKSSYTAGKTVVESDVLGYFVYIPRYKYKLFNTGTGTVSEQLIEIEFESKTTSKSTGSTDGTWLTHPAFTFGTTEVDGLWVGKFEITGTIDDITVKPGLSSVRDETIGSFYTNLLDLDTDHGISASADSHMMKNTEWGAVAYLKQSIYGLGTDDIVINDDSGYYTGGGSTPTSYVANANQSTTGNITGVYDMSGGGQEYVMGVNGTDVGFLGLTLGDIEGKYIDVYTSGTTYKDADAYVRRILGDATSETRSWYSDYAYFVYSVGSWFTRGGFYSNGSHAGVFSFDKNNGSARSYYSARVVFLP